MKDVQKIDETYNRNYLREEYNFAQASAEMAGRWEDFEEDGDEYYLQYRTAGDGNVRPEHAALHGVTLPISDSFWKTYYPPNGWNCRCTVVQVLRSKYPATDHNEAMSRGSEALANDKKGMFRFNPGKEQRTFPAYNPYTISRCATCDKAKLNLAFIPDNQVCDACSQVKKQCDVTSALLSLHEKKGKEFIDTLREIANMRIFKPVEGQDRIFSAIGREANDFFNQLDAAKKAVSHGYTAIVLPNPGTGRTPDQILVKGQFIVAYEVKTIFGVNSVGNRLWSSVGQSNRVLLNMKTQYNSKRLAKEIMAYFESNTDAEEVKIFKGKKEIIVKRRDISKTFDKTFKKKYNK